VTAAGSRFAVLPERNAPFHARFPIETVSRLRQHRAATPTWPLHDLNRMYALPFGSTFRPATPHSASSDFILSSPPYSPADFR
jgi:hypothetical protein